MKNLLLICAAVGALSVSVGKADAKTNPNQSKNKELGSAISHAKANKNPRLVAIIKKQQAALQQSHKAAERTTSATSERLIANSDYNYSYADTPTEGIGIVDSGNYMYSLERGSVFNTDQMTFLTPYGTYFNAGTAFGEYFSGYIPSFTSNINISDVMADTAWYWNSNNSGSTGNDSFEYYEKVYNIYDSNTNISFCSDQVSPIDSTGQWDNFINTYDSSKNITTSLDIQWNGFGWDSNTYTVFFYNSSNQLIEDSTSTYMGGWAASSKDYYTYNTSGFVTFSSGWNNTSGSMLESNQYFITYNSDNTIRTDSASQLQTGTWVPEQTDTFGYTSGADYFTSLYLTIFFSPTISINVAVSKHVNSSYMPDSLIEMIYASAFSSYPNGFVEGVKIGYVYDAYNNPTTAYQYNFTVTDTVTGAGSFNDTVTAMSHYYYQNYSTTAVATVTAPAANVTVFPNPATNNINISITGIAQGARTNIRLENMLGQTMLTESLPWMTETQSLPLTGIAPGTYILQVQDGSGNVLSSQKVVKE